MVNEKKKAFFVPALPILQSVGTYVQYRLYTQSCVCYIHVVIADPFYQILKC